MRTGGTARFGVLVVVAAVGLGVVGVGAVDSFLAVSFADKDPLVAAPRDAGQVVEPAPLPDRVVVDLPEAGDPLLDLAASRLRESLEVAGVEVVDATTAAAGQQGAPGAGVVAELTAGAGSGPESYVRSREGGQIALAAQDRRGLASGLFQLADHVAGGLGWGDVAAGPTTVTPALERRFVDTGAVGIAPDPQAWAAQDDYVHASGALSDIVLDEEPWLDQDRLVEVDAQWREYVDRMVSYGYDGVVVPGFLEYVTFAGVEDGDAVYPPGSPYRERALAMREQVGSMWAYADTMGMDVVMVTDMLALTTPLESYLGTLPGGLDADSEQLWQVYRAGVDELLTELPFVDGVMIRVGEAGAIYNLEGWDYYSALAVTEDEQVRTMLRTFSDVTAEHDADVYLRSWSVGVGQVGDLHTSPDTYDRVLGDLGPQQGVDNLVVSTKFVAGDFDSWLPLNPTLLAGPQQRIVEIQARREFEGFGAFPNDTTGDHAAALQQVDAANPGLDGVWVWTQSGGPQRAGPMSLYLTTGFWQQWDLQVWTSARLAWDPQADLEQLERTWLRRTWSEDPQTVAALSSLQAASREAVLQGLYVEPYAEQEVRAFGLEPPPMMWVFKWDLVSGDTATWAALYEASRGRVDVAVAGGGDAVAAVEQMQGTLAAVDPATFRDPAQHELLTRSLAYERDLFVTLGAYREAMLRGTEWVDTGDPEAREAFEAAAARYREASAAHQATWSGDLDFPPYEFAAADTGLARLSGETAGTWAARALLVASVLALVLVPALRRAALLPWRLDPAGWAAAATWQRAAALLVPLGVVLGAHAAFGSLTSPRYLAWAGALALVQVVGGVVAGVLLAGRKAGRWGAVSPGRASVPLLAAVLAGPQLVAVWPLLGATAWRGPVGAWNGFWLDPAGRAVFVVTAVVVLVWLVVAPALSGAVAPRRAAAAVALGASGAALLWLGGLATVVGQERLLTLLNDEMQVVPSGLSRILGLTVHLGVPAQLPLVGLAAGALLWALALVLLATTRRTGEGRPGRDARTDPGPVNGSDDGCSLQPPAASTVSAAANHSAST